MSASLGEILKIALITINFMIGLIGLTLLPLITMINSSSVIQLMVNGSPFYNLIIWISFASSIFTMVIGFTGAIVSVRDDRALIRASLIVTAIAMFAKLAALTWVIVSKWQEMEWSITDVVNDAVHDSYGTNPQVTLIFDDIQRSFECCGSDSHKDWALAKFNRAHMSNMGLGNSNSTFKVPVSCCSPADTTKCEPFTKGMKLVFTNFDGIIFKDGCRSKLIEHVRPYYPIVFITCGSICFMELLSVILSLAFLETLGGASRARKISDAFQMLRIQSGL